MRSSELVPFLTPPAQDGLGFRQGRVDTFDQNTGENAIEVGGTYLTDVPMLNSGEATALKPGHIVALLTWKSSWWILGRITMPGSDQFASASVAFGGCDDVGVGFAIQTSYAQKINCLIDVPAWADEAQVTAHVHASIENSTAGFDFAAVRAGIDSVFGTGIEVRAPAGHIVTASASMQRLVVDPGPTILIQGQVKSTFNNWGPDLGNACQIVATAVFRSVT